MKDRGIFKAATGERLPAAGEQPIVAHEPLRRYAISPLSH
jgi:hypothetical protein